MTFGFASECASSSCDREPLDALPARRHVGRIALAPDHVAHGLQVGGYRVQAVQVLRVRDQRDAVGLHDLVHQAGTLQRDVDRHLDRADLVQAEPRVEELGAVGQHDRHLVALLDAEREEAVRGAVDALVQLAQRDRIIAELEHHVIGVPARLVLDDLREHAIALRVLVHAPRGPLALRAHELVVPLTHSYLPERIRAGARLPCSMKRWFNRRRAARRRAWHIL